MGKNKLGFNSLNATNGGIDDDSGYYDDQLEAGGPLVNQLTIENNVEVEEALEGLEGREVLLKVTQVAPVPKSGWKTSEGLITVVVNVVNILVILASMSTFLNFTPEQGEQVVQDSTRLVEAGFLFATTASVALGTIWQNIQYIANRTDLKAGPVEAEE